MYNYQKYQLEERLLNQCKESYDKFLKQNKNRRTITESLNKNYKKRFDKFILSVLEDPIQINEYKVPKYDPRDLLILSRAQKSIKLKFHDSKSRVQEIAEKNVCLDPIPFKNSSAHKFRDTSLSLQKKPFKFMLQSAYKSNHQPITSKQQKHKENQSFQSHKRSIYEHYSNTQKLKVKSDKFELNKNISKTLELPRKAYFNSLRTFLGQYSNINGKDQQQNRQEGNEKPDSQIDKQAIRAFKMNLKSNQEINRKSKAIQALTKCGFLKQNITNSTHHKSSMKS